ncbi:MAG: ribosome maturation factor RimP [Candidatus Thioglobus sp.]|jgi:ribosome maturation factor RimP|nr:MAG: ribosome maturation factor RimP [Candidatus Thioglobus sp.]
MVMRGICELIEPVIEDMGYELVTVELTGSQSGGQIVRAYIDAPGGILLEDCEQVSRQISAIFDVEDPIKGEYTLEVSSPGLERPLAKPAHFLRFIGSKVKVQTKTLHLGRRRFTGPLTEATEESCCIEVDGEVYELPYQDIDKANLVAFESGHSQNRAS